MTRTDDEHLANAREHLRILMTHLDRTDLNDSTVFDAVCMRLSAAIESLTAIDEQVRFEVFGTTWTAIASVRNRIAHGYAFVDRQIIADTIEHDLPELHSALDRIEARLE